MTILQINTSIQSEKSNSSRLANRLVTQLQHRHPSKQVLIRNLAKTPHPLIDEAVLQAMLTPAEQRTAGQAQRVALDDELIVEVQQADYLVITAQMYNFGIPVFMPKAWR